MKILILLKFGKQIFKLVKHIFLLFFKKINRIMPTGIEKKILIGLGNFERRKQKNFMLIYGFLYRLYDQRYCFGAVLIIFSISLFNILGSPWFSSPL